MLPHIIIAYFNIKYVIINPSAYVLKKDEAVQEKAQ